ncbi:MAG TPA: prolyl oligopeptidase family serine peptidase [Usitatibacter sp.]|nr:prolyl oligopeptidase family serine peptidase [Usitatibacter sp.]
MSAPRPLRFLAAAACAAALVHAADPPAAPSASPVSAAFLQEQSQRAREALDRIPGRAALLQRVRALSQAGTAVRDIRMEAGRVFYLKTPPGAPSAVLCMREGLAGAERVIVDPRARPDGGEDAAIDWYSASPDGRHVAFGMSRAGAETLLHVAGVDDGRDLPFEIDRTRPNRHLAWQPDGKAFYYSRLPEGSPEANARIYRHVLGRETARDEVVFAPGVGGARDIPGAAESWLVLPRESRYAFAVVRAAPGEPVAVHVTLQKDLAAGRPRWHEIATVSDGVVEIDAWRDDLYLLSQREAPNRRVLRVAASADDLGRARLVVPEGDAAIVAMGLARDAIYLRTMVAGVDRLERVHLGLLGAGSREFLRLPYDMAITEIVADPRRNGAILRMEGWTRAPEVAEVDARTGDLRDTKLAPPSGADYSSMDEVRLYAPTADGARIPITLLYRRSTRLTGDNPTLLVGYGAYGDPSSPVFDAARLAWLERGGVFAVAHLRGGGEYGERWHQAGRGAAKATTIADFVAACEFLERYGFTNNNRLAVEGTEAGAIPVGGALVRRPDLFAAVIARDPMLDLAALGASAAGRARLPEFGSLASTADRERLLTLSPYQQVREGMPYPAVMLSVAAGDPGEALAQAARMAARLERASTSGKPVLLRLDAPRGGARLRRDEELADIYSFALWQLGDADFQPAPPAPPQAPPGESAKRAVPSASR